MASFINLRSNAAVQGVFEQMVLTHSTSAPDPVALRTILATGVDSVYHDGSLADPEAPLGNYFIAWKSAATHAACDAVWFPRHHPVCSSWAFETSITGDFATELLAGGMPWSVHTDAPRRCVFISTTPAGETWAKSQHDAGKMSPLTWEDVCTSASENGSINLFVEGDVDTSEIKRDSWAMRKCQKTRAVHLRTFGKPSITVASASGVTHVKLPRANATPLQAAVDDCKKRDNDLPDELPSALPALRDYDREWVYIQAHFGFDSDDGEASGLLLYANYISFDASNFYFPPAKEGDQPVRLAIPRSPSGISIDLAAEQLCNHIVSAFAPAEFKSFVTPVCNGKRVFDTKKFDTCAAILVREMQSTAKDGPVSKEEAEECLERFGERVMMQQQYTGGDVLETFSSDINLVKVCLFGISDNYLNRQWALRSVQKLFSAAEAPESMQGLDLLSAPLRREILELVSLATSRFDITQTRKMDAHRPPKHVFSFVVEQADIRKDDMCYKPFTDITTSDGKTHIIADEDGFGNWLQFNQYDAELLVSVSRRRPDVPQEQRIGVYMRRNGNLYVLAHTSAMNPTRIDVIVNYYDNTAVAFPSAHTPE